MTVCVLRWCTFMHACALAQLGYFFALSVLPGSRCRYLDVGFDTGFIRLVLSDTQVYCITLALHKAHQDTVVILLKWLPSFRSCLVACCIPLKFLMLYTVPSSWHWIAQTRNKQWTCFAMSHWNATKHVTWGHFLCVYFFEGDLSRRFDRWQFA